MPLPTAVVTGASRGIGRAVALRLAGDFEIVAVARSDDELESLAQEIESRGGACRPRVVDLTDPTAIHAALADIDAQVLVSNAGVGALKPFMELTRDEWTKMVNLNFTALFDVTRAVAPSMIARSHGKIINIGSMWGRAGVARYTAYCVTKAGVEALTRCLAVEWARHGIRVNCLAPGYVDTDFNRETFADERLRTAILSKIPLRRIARVDEIGPLAVYLASAASDFMTGQTVYLDGGQTIAG
jgi:NAD(P)-dependent dehydrogenase (short-subunit alcohol dehydrogenase family)